MNLSWDTVLPRCALALTHVHEATESTCNHAVMHHVSVLYLLFQHSLNVFDFRYALTVWFSRKKKGNNTEPQAEHDQTPDASSHHKSADKLLQAADLSCLQQTPSSSKRINSALSADAESQPKHRDLSSASATESSTKPTSAMAASSAPAMADVNPSSTGDSASTSAIASAQPSPAARPQRGRVATAAGLTAHDKPVHETAQTVDNSMAALSQTTELEHDNDMEAGNDNTSAVSAPTKKPHDDMIQGSACTLTPCNAVSEPVHDMTPGADNAAGASTATAEAEKDSTHEAPVACGDEGCKPGSIFVSIAAYRDPECQWTMRDLFRQAEEPGLVTVGVVWQIDAVADAAFVRVAGNTQRTQRHQQVRSY